MVKTVQSAFRFSYLVYYFWIISHRRPRYMCKGQLSTSSFLLTKYSNTLNTVQRELTSGAPQKGAAVGF